MQVIERVGISEAGLTAAGTAVVDVWYSEVGTLDTATAQFRSPTPGLLIRGDCELKLVGDQWKVVDPKATAFMGVQAAERYLKELLATAKDPAVRRNATRTLAALKKLAGRGM